MSDSTNTETTESVATLAELKKSMPDSSADFREQQIEAGATLNEALSSYNVELAAENKRLVDEKSEADKKAIEAEEKAAAAAKAAATNGAPKRGNPAVATNADGAGEEGGTDYVQMARAEAKESKISFREASHNIKKRFPEAREQFLGPVLNG